MSLKMALYSTLVVNVRSLLPSMCQKSIAGYEVSLPAVLGIQAARQAPRYVAVSRIKQAQDSDALTETDASPPASSSGITITAVRIPESGEGAEMIEGDEEAAADKIVELLVAAGVGGAS